MTIQLETDRIILREIDHNDLDVMLKLHNHPEVQTYLGEEYPVEADFIKHVIDNIWQKEYATIGHGRWATVLKETGEVMGWAGLKYLEDYKIVDLGYRFFPEFWGMGIATECSFALRDCAFDRFKMEELWGMAWFKNKPSNHILQKIGLRFVKRAPYDEVSNDVMWYKLTMDEYQELNEKEANEE